MDVVLFFLLGHLLQVTAVCSVTLALISMLFQMRKKHLLCEILSKGFVAPRGVQIMVRGKPVQDLYHFKIKIRNSGARAIKPKNFYKELIFDFGGGVQILNAEVIRSSYPPSHPLPANLPQPGQRPGEVMLPNILWNRRDWVELEVLLIQQSNNAQQQNNSIRDPQYSGKIKGGNIVGTSSKLFNLICFAFFITSLIGLINLRFIYNMNLFNYDGTVAIILLLIVAVRNTIK